MSRVRPILFNTGMTEAVLEDWKTATRRLVKQAIWEDFVCEGGKVVNYFDQKTKRLESPIHKAPCQPGDILYIRENWTFIPCIDCMEYGCNEKIPVTYEDRHSVAEGCFLYRAGHENPERITWRPSIHMPKAAARIWLKVKDVRAEHLQEMTLDDFLAEGVCICPEAFNDPANAYMQARNKFIEIWDSTLPRGQQDLYSWEADPWVWTIEFERCRKPEGEE